MKRRFLNLVVHEYGSRLYSLCRLDLSNHLFYATVKEATSAHEAANAQKKRVGWPSTISSRKRLPAAAMNFSAPPRSAAVSNMHFFSLLREQGEDCVMFADPSCNTSVYDASTKSISLTHQSYFCKPYDSIALSIRSRCGGGNLWGREEDDHGLYVLSSIDGSFEFFNYCRIASSAFVPSLYNRWYWSPLPSPPPCLGYHRTAIYGPPLVAAAAVVDNSTICASVKDSTYTFDTSTEVWSHAGSWVLPFYRAAEYVPELSLWFGLQAPATPQHLLCAFDLSASAMTDSAAPSSLHAWDYLDGLPDEWLPVERALVNLDSGRFCISTYFMRKFSHDLEEEARNEVQTVLTSVEVVRCGDGLQMIKHKSERYNIKDTIIQCVL